MSPTTKDSLRVGQRFKPNLPKGKHLFVNDNYQFGTWIEEELNTATRYKGEIVSGKLHPTALVYLIDLCDSDPDTVIVKARKADGSYDWKPSIKLDLFKRYFVAA